MRTPARRAFAIPEIVPAWIKFLSNSATSPSRPIMSRPVALVEPGQPRPRRCRVCAHPWSSAA